MRHARKRSSFTPLSTLLLILCLGHLPAPLAAEPPALMLANTYRANVAVADYWVSEKLDGVRAYWDGVRLIARGGQPIAAPAWFTEGFPTPPLDGELWMGRGRFAEVSGAVRRAEPEAAQWQQIRYMVFDLPGASGGFSDRLKALQRIVSKAALPHLQLVEQSRVANRIELMTRLDRVAAAGGEGLMLHHAAAPYRPIRSDDLLKMKTYDDAEAIVVAHLPGKGKYTGLVGSLLVENGAGQRFRLGSGLSDLERQAPPPVGTTITYKHHGLTSNGLPRFASYLRPRN